MKRVFKQTNNNYYLSTLEQDAINNFNDITWKEYRIGDLFESENGDFDIQKSHINNNGYFVITSGLMNNGILGKSDVLSKIFREQTITVDMFGNVFYRSFKYKLVTHARVFSLIPKFIITENVGLFFENSLDYFKNLFDYNHMCSWKKIKNLNIQLPIKNNQIDFNFIENFINAIQKLILKNIYIWIQSQINNK
ncbi:restriction endonuclease subunit S [Mycoplasmopsis felis]|uniref:restriction endonuclease subunit S n=1 Tax=Mycoplasmopsis felis TaxID=33923 RepID=UPI002B0021D9|nr:restriction endonuclease subunit S [Mycoplasmopsis felis]WQQ08892.1 restriction endonuclease subunit S [Mycoplasmopsis felis]